MLATLAPQGYEAVREQVRHGDILLCSARDIGSRPIRRAARSPWRHIAIASQLEEMDWLLALECVDHIGVHAVPLYDFIHRTSSGQGLYPGIILLARHAGMAAQSDAAKIGLRLALGRLNIKFPGLVQPDDEYIYFEYVACCLAAVDIAIPWDKLGFIAPSDFALDPDIEAVAQVRH